jgi:hypothetical protein
MVYLIVALLCGLAGAAGGRLTACLAFVTGGVVAYLTLPVLAIDFASVPFLVLCVLAMAVFLGASHRRHGEAGLGAGLLVGGIAVFTLAWLSTSATLFHADRYRTVVGTVDTLDNHPELSSTDAARFRVVDEALARRMAERVLGEDGALGSQVTIGRMTLQLVAGEWLWVGPLNHSSLLRWAANASTPGYVTVSATAPDDPKAARLVLTLDQQPLALVYNGGGRFWTDPRRVLYERYPTLGLGQMHFELDDTGRPFWVMTTYEHTIGYSGARVTGAILLDPQTGEDTPCATADCPAWVDMLQDEDLLLAQVGWWGEFAEGWWNPSGRNKLAVTPITARAVDAAGHQYFYTGITSVSADQGTAGYILADTRTGQTTFYRQAGATETAAMRSAEGTVQEKGYEAASPVPYNIGGTWTYFIPLKDQAGFPKAFAFVSVENDQILAVGDTPAQAIRAYRQRLLTSGRATGDDVASGERLTGVITRIAADVRDGTTHYLVMVGGHEDRIFVGTSATAATLPLAAPGDSVEIQYLETDRGVVDMTAFSVAGQTLRRSATEQRSGVAQPSSTEQPSGTE